METKEFRAKFGAVRKEKNLTAQQCADIAKAQFGAEGASPTAVINAIAEEEREKYLDVLHAMQVQGTKAEATNPPKAKTKSPTTKGRRADGDPGAASKGSKVKFGVPAEPERQARGGLRLSIYGVIGKAKGKTADEIVAALPNYDEERVRKALVRYAARGDLTRV